MLRRFLVRRATLWDALEMLRCARHEDRVEWEASVEQGLAYLPWSVEWCATHGEALTVYDTKINNVALLAGAQPQEDGRVLTWMVVAEGVEEWGLALMKDYKDYLDAFFQRWPHTECYSDSRNVLHHMWLQYLGYELIDEVGWGPHGFPFLHFKRGD